MCYWAHVQDEAELLRLLHAEHLVMEQGNDLVLHVCCHSAGSKGPLRDGLALVHEQAHTQRRVLLLRTSKLEKGCGRYLLVLFVLRCDSYKTRNS